MLWPASHEEGYLPETWELEGCRGELRTLGFDGLILKLQAQASAPLPSPIQEPTPVGPSPPPVPEPADFVEKIEFRVPHKLPLFRIGEADQCRFSRRPTEQGLDVVEGDCRRSLNGPELRFPGGEFANIPGADLEGVLRPRQLRPTSGKGLEGKPPSELWYCYGQCTQSANWSRASRRGKYFSAPAVDDWATPVEVRAVWRFQDIRYFVPFSLFELSRQEDLTRNRISPWGGRFRFPAPKVRFEARGGTALSDSCRLYRGTRTWVLDCDEAPAGQTLELRGYLDSSRERPADTLTLNIRDSKQVTLVSHIRHFYLSPLRHPPKPSLVPLSLAQGRATWPCRDSGKTPPIYRCDVQDPSGDDRYGVRLEQGGEEARQQAPLFRGETASLEDLFAQIPLVIDPGFPQGRNPDDWMISVFTDRDCKDQTATEDTRATAGQSVRATRRGDANRYSECLRLAAKDLTIAAGELARKVRFTHLRRRIPRPEDMPWQTGYRIQWNSPLPPGCRELSGESGLLECDDDLTVAETDWPQLTVTNAKGASVLSATLGLSDPGAPGLVDPRYSVFLQGPPGIRPQLEAKGECIQEGEVWRCELPELSVSRLTLMPADGGEDSFSYDIAERTLTPAESYDWTTWLPELPLRWAGEGDLDLAYPATHWRDLLIWSQPGCSGQPPRAIDLTRLQGGPYPVRAPVGGSARIAQGGGGRQTACTPLDKETLRLSARGLELAFAPQLETATRQLDRRRMLLVDVSRRMIPMARELLAALRVYDPSRQSAESLVLVADSPQIEIHAEDLNPATYRAALDRLRFDRYPGDALTFIALGLSPFEGSRGHQLRVLLAYRWVDTIAGSRYSTRSLGFLNQVIRDQAIESPIEIFLLEATEADCATLLDNWPRNRLHISFDCRPLTTNQLGTLLRGGRP